MTTPNARRDAVLKAMRDHAISQRRACVLVGVDPKTVRRERPPDNPEIRTAMQEIAALRRRFGYRRIGLLLERRGMLMGIVAELGVEAGFPITPSASCHAFGLGCAERVEAVNERHTDVDFSRLPVRVS